MSKDSLTVQTWRTKVSNTNCKVPLSCSCREIVALRAGVGICISWTSAIGAADFNDELAPESYIGDGY